MGVDDEGAPSRASSQEVVAGVADDQTQVVSAGEPDAGLDVRMCLGSNDIDTIVSKSAWGRRIRGRNTGVIGEVLPEQHGILVGPKSLPPSS